jgi:GYF domain 2
MKMASDVRKVLLFGILGAAGCLMGWAIGEPFLNLAMPATDSTSAASLVSKPALPALDEAAAPRPPVAPPPIELAAVRTAAPPASPAAPKIAATAVAESPPPPPDFEKRLQKAGAKSGDVQISLLWNNVNDLDLHCIDPRGEEIFYDHTHSASGGQLDVDANGGGPMTATPVENIFWPKGKAPKGKYQVYLVYYAKQSAVDATKYKINVLSGGKRKEYSGQISASDGRRHICDFEIADPVPPLQVAASPEAVVYAGGSNRVSVRVARRPGDGPIFVKLANDVAGIWSKELELGPTESEGQLELTAGPNAAPGSRTITIAASNGKDKATTEVKLTVRKPAAELRVAASADIVLEQGQSNKLPVRVARANFSGPVKLTLEGDVSGLTAEPVDLPEAQAEATIEIRSDIAAKAGDRSLHVVAQAGSERAEAAVKLTITQVPPVLRLSLADEIRVNQRGVNQLPYRLARAHFAGPVTMTFAGDLAGIAPTSFVVDETQTDGEITLTAEDAALGSRTIEVTATGAGVRAQQSFRLTIAPPTGPQWSWWTILCIGLWTALLAGGLALFLVAGQNRYVGRPLLSVRELAVIVAGSLLAGVIAGGLGQFLYAVLLGGLLGRGVVWFIPNLNATKATLAGLAGGALGAAAFLGVSTLGDWLGRFAGAALLGFAIGLMVAIVEAYFRKVWLEIRHGPREVRRINLGDRPVLVGGDQSRCTALVRGAPALALRFTQKDGQLYCLDVLAEKTIPVGPGYRRPLMDVEVVVCSSEERTFDFKPLQLLARRPSDVPKREPKPAPKPVSAPVVEGRWFHAFGGKKSGPFTPSQLRDRFRTGVLLPGDRILHEGTTQWVTAEESGLLESDDIRFDCPECGKHLRADPTHAGRAVKCSKATCGAIVRVPSAS